MASIRAIAIQSKLHTTAVGRGVSDKILAPIQSISSCISVIEPILALDKEKFGGMAADKIITDTNIVKVFSVKITVDHNTGNFYMYQPGHLYSAPELNRTLAQDIYSYPVTRPVYMASES